MSMTAPPIHPLPLEDGFADVLNKAKKGLKLSLDELAERSGLLTQDVEAALNGAVSPAHLEKLAFVLNLHAPSLIALAEAAWRPASGPVLPGLAQFTTWYGDMMVNAYLVWDPATGNAASFDTGATCEPMLDFLANHKLTLQKILITHTHMDHLADLDALQAAYPDADSYGSAVENPLGLKPLAHEDGLILDQLRIRVLGTSGHTPGGLSYWVTGLERPLVIVGDALFAGSMGGAAYAYAEAKHNNEQRLLTLPAETLICPGHGPMTTVGEERLHNPFFPALKA